jgi:hypothetical protein
LHGLQLQACCMTRDTSAAAARDLHDLALALHQSRPRFTVGGVLVSNQGRRRQLLDALGKVSGLLAAQWARLGWPGAVLASA